MGWPPDRSMTMKHEELVAWLNDIFNISSDDHLATLLLDAFHITPKSENLLADIYRHRDSLVKKP